MNTILKILFVASLVSGCSFHEVETIEPNTLANNGINVPDGFDYSTHQQVKVVINDASRYASYEVFAYSDELEFMGNETFQNEAGENVTEPVYKSDVLNKLIFTGVPRNGQLVQTISISKHYNKLYIRRNENLAYSSSVERIAGNQVVYNHFEASNKSVGKFSSFSEVVNDFLFCVNSAGELFQVNPLNGELTYLSDMPMGSVTCAVDQQNKVLYSIGKSSPFPLMKYSIQTNTWQTVANLGRGGPRLDYNHRDGLLYFSTGSKLYTYNPSNGVNISVRNIVGLDNLNGGDLAFAEDGTLFMCTFSGLYRLQLDATNTYQSTRISADNLPFEPTSMTFDSNQELWLANNATSSDLIVMDTQTGGWKYMYGINANNNTNFGRAINDLTTFKTYTQLLVDPDTDSDGIVDRIDSYPTDANKAFEMFTPSKYGWGTVAFEDLWPSNGDYDFNDLAVNYRAIAVLNSSGLAVQLDFLINTKSNMAGFTNGFGIEIESLSPNQIQSVTGSILTQNYISLNPNGTETGQDNAVIIIFDNPNAMINGEHTISVKFNSPISTEVLGAAPFNPFMIVNKTRENEVHLAYKNRTNLAANTLGFSGLNNDVDGNYISANGFPWAINIVHDFKVPKERIAINQAYNFFNAWATSGGEQYKDWYKDGSGYRNTQNLQN